MSGNKERQRRGLKINRRLAVLLAGPLAIAMAGGYFYFSGGHYISTDNAYLKAEKVPIASEVAGKVIAVSIKDNQRVAKGDPLFRIDPEPYRIAMERAEAKLASIHDDLKKLRADCRQKESELEKAEENVRYWSGENDRYQKLLETNTISPSRAGEIEHSLRDALKGRDAAKQALRGALASLDNKPDERLDDLPRYREAAAELDRARLDLQRTEVSAPQDGVAAHVQLAVGEYVLPGAPLFSLIDDRHVWVEANFKEGDLARVRPGQKATVEVDTYAGQKQPASVVSITPLTGAEASILPPQNASGNWVKVVQRIMVRLEFERAEDLPPLVAGMSSYVSIDTGSR